MNNGQVNMNIQTNGVPVGNPNAVNQPQVQANTNSIRTDFSNKQNEVKKVKMIRYKYKVKDVDGKIVESYFDAENKNDVESFLLNKSYEIISVEEDKLSTSLGLASMASSRVPLVMNRYTITSFCWPILWTLSVA